MRIVSISDRILFLAWLFELAGGAISDFEDSCVPKSQRDTLFTVAALHQWELGVNDIVRSFPSPLSYLLTPRNRDV